MKPQTKNGINRPCECEDSYSKLVTL